MNRWLVTALCFAFVGAWARAEDVPTYKGLELKVLGAERVKVYRDLKVKDEKKQDLLVVRLEVRWTEETRHLLIEDDDLSVKDAKGGSYGCALTFVQRTADANRTPSILEIPFRVKAEVAITTLRLDKTVIPIDSPASVSKP
jgi:hypothetical protein